MVSAASASVASRACTNEATLLLQLFGSSTVRTSPAAACCLAVSVSAASAASHGCVDGSLLSQYAHQDIFFGLSDDVVLSIRAVLQLTLSLGWAPVTAQQLQPAAAAGIECSHALTTVCMMLCVHNRGGVPTLLAALSARSASAARARSCDASASAAASCGARLLPSSAVAAASSACVNQIARTSQRGVTPPPPPSVLTVCFALQRPCIDLASKPGHSGCLTCWRRY